MTRSPKVGRLEGLRLERRRARFGDLLILLDGARAHAYGTHYLAVSHEGYAAGEHDEAPAVGVAQAEDGAAGPRILLQVRALRLPPASTTAMSMGCPISSAFRSAPSMTRRASSSVMVSFVFAASAILSLSRCFPSMLALEPLRRDLAQYMLARSQTHVLYPLALL
jgi:hypothetical protein